MAENLWNDVAADYERSFATLCAGTVPTVLEKVPPGSTVLDVGCGSGHLTAALAAAGHAVSAVDPDPQMVALTTARADVDARVGGLPDLPHADASFDAVTANFVLNHVDDPRRAAAGLARVLRPGGRVVATIWPGFAPPQGVMWGAVLDAAGAVRPDLPRLAEHLDFERSTVGLSAVLASAGLEPVAATTPTWQWRVDPDDLWAGLTAVGNFGVGWRAQTDEVRGRMQAAYAEEQGPWRDGADLAFGVECLMVEAVRRA